MEWNIVCENKLLSYVWKKAGGMMYSLQELECKYAELKHYNDKIKAENEELRKEVTYLKESINHKDQLISYLNGRVDGLEFPISKEKRNAELQS